MVFSVNVSNALDLNTPEKIRKELRLSQIKYKDKVWTFKIFYPGNFNPLRVHPVLLVLSGGNASEKIVDYTYYSLFRGDATKGFIKIFPLAPEGKSLNDLDSSEITDLLFIIKDSEFFKDTPWFLAGASNGGIAAFNFAKYAPDRFREIIALPGVPQFDTIPTSWKEYNILLAYGQLDKEWKTATNLASNKLKNKVKNVFVYELKNVNHIIPKTYNIDSIFFDFFSKSYPNWNKKQIVEIPLGEITPNGFELLIDEEIIKLYMSKEIGNGAFIDNILIQKDEENEFFLYGEGKIGKEFLIMKISLKNDNNKLLLQIKSVLEYCITQNKCPKPVFSITGKCQCSRQNQRQQIEFFKKEGFVPGEPGIGSFFM